MPQVRQRRDVPVLHGHARGGARHARARQRAREGALRAGPARGDGRRAPARDPRPLPRVQGVQERVPAERRHGVAEVRVPLAPPGRSTACRCARGCSARSAGSTGRRGARAALQPAARVPGARALLERTLGIARGARCRASRASTSCAGTGAARAGCRRSRRRGLPRRLVHHLHRAGDRPRGDRAARGGRLARAAGERGLLRAASSISKGLLDQARGMAAAMAARLAPDAERGVPIVGCEPSCLLTLREEHLALLGATPRAGGRPRRPSSSRSCSSRRSTTARCAGPGLARERPADRLPRPLPPEGARGHRGDGRAARAHPGRAGHRARRRLLRDGRLVRLRGRALRAVDADRRIAPVPGAAGGRTPEPWSPRPGCHAASRSATGVGLRARHPVELVARGAGRV